MKYKTQDVDVPSNNKVDTALFELLQLECDKLSLLNCAKHYFWDNGFVQYKKFLKKIFKECSKFKWNLEEYLMSRELDIPELSLPKFTKFDSAEDAFEQMSSLEDKVFDKMMEIATIAFDEKDVCALMFITNIISDAKKHIMCKAALAVNNKQDPNLLICEQPSMEN